MSIEKVTKHFFSQAMHMHGATAKGVGWNGSVSQKARFGILSRLIEKESFSLNDLGCGYGEYYNYLKGYYADFTYHGFDLCLPMIQKANSLFEHDDKCSFRQSRLGEKIRESNYTIASGIFNMKKDVPDDLWEENLFETLNLMDASSLDGFSFNCLTKYSDPECMQDELYYADPCKVFDYCKRNFSRHVALLHDYELYEFTIIVRKSV